MNYGKRSVEESYFNGQLKSRKVRYSVPEVVQDKTQAMSEIIKGLELITSKQTYKLTIDVTADPKTHNFRMVTKTYIVEE